MIRLFILLFFISITLDTNAQTERYRFMQPKMGSPFNLIFYAKDSATAARLAAASFALVDSLNHIFSDYDKRSELNRLSRTAGSDSFVPVSEPMYAVLLQSRTAWKKSRGTFDITMGPLSWLWRNSRRQGQFPADSAVQQNLQKTGFYKIELDIARRRVKLLDTGMQLDLGAIAKGYVAQAVITFLKAHGVTSALADAGGDIACSNAPPATVGWTVGINVPEQENELLNKTISLQNKAVATSGDVYQFTKHGGKKYSHIIDPRTGYGVTFQRNVTIIAPDGATADWLATACSILPVRQAKKLVRQYNAALLIGVLKGDRVRFYKTRSFSRYLR